MKKKILSLLTAFAMVFGIIAAPFTSASADGESTEEGAKTNTIVLHKILQTADNMKAKDNEKKDVLPGRKGIDGTPYDGNAITDLAAYFGENSKEIKDVFFAVQNAQGQYIGKDGNALANPSITDVNFEDNVLGGKTTETGLTLDTSKLTQDKTEYKIVEIVELSTYKSEDGKILAAKKAVPVDITLPITNEKGVVLEAHVYPKNTEEKPQIDKNFGKKEYKDPAVTDSQDVDNDFVEVKKGDKDLSTETGEDKSPVVSPTDGANYDNYAKEKARVTAELGKEVPYEVKTKINAGTKYQTLNWKDTMTNGLTFLPDSLKIQAKTKPTTDEGEVITLTKGTDYKVTADDRGFTLSITADGFKKINAKTHPEDANGKQNGDGVDVEFTLTYKAKVNKNAIQDIPEKNDIKLEYSNNKEEEKQSTPVTPQNGELKITKTWSDNTTKDVQVVYTLSNGTKSYAVMMDGNKTTGTVDLGDGITFEITGAYAGTFKGEALNSGSWTIAERVAGYNETVGAATAGTAVITNTKDEKNPTPLNPTEPEVVYYGKRFVKADEKDGTRLQGAEFVIKNNNEGENKGKFLALKHDAMTSDEKTALTYAKSKYDEAVKAWNDAVKADPDKKDDDISVTLPGEASATVGKTAVMAKIAELQGKYETAFKAAKNAYTWVKSDDPATDATNNLVKLVSDAQGKFEITGLEKGSYLLVETKTPGKYAKLNDQTFTVDAGTYEKHANGVVYSSDEKAIKVGKEKTSEAQRVDNKLVSIPQTGGIGSLIFIAAGLAIMGGAFVAYKKSQATA